MKHTCDCGIKCISISPYVSRCPRCGSLYSLATIPPKKITAEDIDRFQNTVVEAFKPVAKVFTEAKKAIATAVLTDTCEQCGGPILEGCGVVCPSCKFVNPCRTDR
jgi:hypothetical protein